MSDKSSPLKHLVIEINVWVKLPEGENIFTLLRILMQVTLSLSTAWRESHASHYDRVVPKRKYLRFLRWVEAEMVSPEVESEKWRRLLLHWMYDALNISTDGREEDFFPRNGVQTVSVRSQQTSPIDSRSSRPSSYPLGFLHQQRPGISKRWRFKQTKLTNLTIDERYDLNVALRMFTRRIVIQRRVEDLQLGVESYQKKLNLTKPDTFRSNLRNKTTYTAYSDPKGVIYKDQMNRNRLMRADELHKFSDGTLDDVRSALNDITKGIRMEYLSRRKWSDLDKRRARVMIQDIDKKLFKRRLMRNLEKFVGGREYGNDLRLLERTI
ncbi:hypothetical protein Tco_0585023 [Tanacetum coccineum]